MERVRRIELPSSAWKAVALPLSYTRRPFVAMVVGEVGLEPTKAFASGFTVRPLCRSGHSPSAPPSRTSGRRNKNAPPDGASLGPVMATRPTPVNEQKARSSGLSRRSLSGEPAGSISGQMANMSDRRPPRRRQRDSRDQASRSSAKRQADRLWLYGIHTVSAALANPRRAVLRLLATDNARQRLDGLGQNSLASVEPTTPKELDRLLGLDVVHQGVALEVKSLPPSTLDQLGADARLLLLLDQVTDPHNVGAILRSAAAMAADAVIVTARHSPAETGTLAKAASGALDLIPLIVVPNLARALEQIGEAGFYRIGLDSSGPESLEDALGHDRLALVVGAEGKGLRQRTRQLCDRLARLTLPGEVHSLNVSVAAALALYSARRHLALHTRS